MLSSIATHEPLPLVPATVTTLHRGGRRWRASSTDASRSRLMSMRFGCSVSNQVSQWSSGRPRRAELVTSALSCSGQRGPSAELGEQSRDLIAGLSPVENHVDGALLEQKLRALEPL